MLTFRGDLSVLPNEASVRFGRYCGLGTIIAIAALLSGCATNSAGHDSETVTSSPSASQGTLQVAAADGDVSDSADAADADQTEDEGDPLEDVNRAVFEFNDAADRFVVRPLAIAYRDAVPDPAQHGIHNALGNLRAPIVFANDLLQAQLHRASVTLTRFLINSTVGVLGLMDVARDWGLPQHDEDFGLTFASWDIDQGPYLVLPILGPSNPRDASGQIIEFFTDPFSIIASDNDADYLNYSRYGLTVLDQRSSVLDELDTIRSTSLDYYAAIRSLSQQRRAQQIRSNQSSGQGPSGSSAPNAGGTPSGAQPGGTAAPQP